VNSTGTKKGSITK